MIKKEAKNSFSSSSDIFKESKETKRSLPLIEQLKHLRLICT